MFKTKLFTDKESVAIGFLAITFIIGMGINYIRDGIAEERLEESVPLMLKEIAKFEKTSAMIESRIAEEVNTFRLNEDGSLKAIEINKAGFEALTLLPGIGPVIAKRILTRRNNEGPFERAEDLLSVRGIGVKKFAKIEKLIVMGNLDNSTEE